MPLITLPPIRSDKSNDLAIAKQAKKRTKAVTTVKGGGGIATQIANIKAMVLKNLGKYEGETICIRDEVRLADYIAEAIKVGEIAIDTETTGLDPLLDICVGVCLYTVGQKTAYVPMNHISYITMEKIENQLSKEVVAKYLKMLTGECVPFVKKVKVIMFNASFDIRVIKNQIGVKLSCYWDCQIASRLLNENEPKGEGGLKPLHKKYVLNGVGDAFAFDSLFKGIKFNLVPINIGYLYAAHDAKITYELYQFQKQYLYYEPECTFDDRNGMNGVSYTFFNIEMPCIDVVVDMEDTGIALDLDYASVLSEKFHKLKDEALDKFYSVLEEYQDKIDAYGSDKLDNPINIASPTQLSILFYDILGYEAVDKKSPRGTGDAILQKWDTPLANAISEYRAIDKLIGTYIDKLPECVNPNDGRIHCKFNQYGADTGRMSSSDPNLQSIPSHNKDIRPMFRATDCEYVVDSVDNSFVVSKWCEVETPSGFVYASSIHEGDYLLCEDKQILVNKVEMLIDNNQIKLYY